MAPCRAARAEELARPHTLSVAPSLSRSADSPATLERDRIGTEEDRARRSVIHQRSGHQPWSVERRRGWGTGRPRRRVHGGGGTRILRRPDRAGGWRRSLVSTPTGCAPRRRERAPCRGTWCSLSRGRSRCRRRRTGGRAGSLKNVSPSAAGSVACRTTSRSTSPSASGMSRPAPKWSPISTRSIPAGPAYSFSTLAPTRRGRTPLSVRGREPPEHGPQTRYKTGTSAPPSPSTRRSHPRSQVAPAAGVSGPSSPTRARRSTPLARLLRSRPQVRILLGALAGRERWRDLKRLLAQQRHDATRFERHAAAPHPLLDDSHLC
jgi:hypothetical protein